MPGVLPSRAVQQGKILLFAVRQPRFYAPLPRPRAVGMPSRIRLENGVVEDATINEFLRLVRLFHKSSTARSEYDFSSRLAAVLDDLDLYCVVDMVGQAAHTAA